MVLTIVQPDDFNTENVYLIHRPVSVKLKNFFDIFENLLIYLNCKKAVIVAFDDFKVNTAKESAEKQYETLLAVYDFEVHKTLPTRYTPNSKSCLDRMIVFIFKMLKTNIIPTTIGNQNTVTADLLLE